MMSNTNEHLASRLAGVTAVPVTPFQENGSTVSIGTIHELVRRMDSTGVHCLAALGNTAEIFQLSDDERADVLAAVAEARQDMVIIAGVAGHLSSVIRQCVKVSQLGYDAVMIHEPLDPLSSSAGITKYMVRIADESPLPVIPYLRTKRMTMSAVRSLVTHQKVVGVKYALTDVASIAQLLSDPAPRGACTWICGAAESMVPVYMANGVTGFTSGLANIRPDLVVALWEAAAQGRLTEFQELYALLLPLELLRVRNDGRHNISVIKYALESQGYEIGEVRPPCENLDQATVEELLAIMTSWDEAADISGRSSRTA